MDALAKDQWGNPGSTAEDRARLLALCESHAEAERTDGTDRTPLPTCSDFESSRHARLEAAPGRDGIPQGLLREIGPVSLQTVMPNLEDRLRVNNTHRLAECSDSALVLQRQPFKVGRWLAN